MEAFSCPSEGRCERQWRQQLMQRNMPFCCMSLRFSGSAECLSYEVL
jgi:hypothetical protein